MTLREIQQNKKRRIRHRQIRKLRAGAVNLLRMALPLAAILCIVACTIAVTAHTVSDMLSQGDTDTTVKAAALKEPDTEEIDDWNDVDMRGFCYHEISEECKTAGGDFPLMAQMYTYVACRKYNVDYEMVFALIERESECNATAAGDNGESQGYMQIASKWHKSRMEILNCTDMSNPYQNIEVGVDYIAELQDRLRDIPEDIRPYYVLAAYNMGYSGAKTNLWDKGRYEYDYNTQIMDRAAELKAEKEQQLGGNGNEDNK